MQAVFWPAACLALSGAVMVIVSKNPMRAVLSLILTFCATAVTWLVMDAEFLGLSLILVYVGAVMVLFIFVVMMLDIQNTTMAARFTRWLPVGLFVAVTLGTTIWGILLPSDRFVTLDATPLAYSTDSSNTSMLGELVFTKYLLQFEAAGVLLLVAIIAAIALIYRGPRARKIQNIPQQIEVVPSERISLVDGT